MMEIKLSRGKIALIDDCDLDLVSGYTWCAYKGHNTFYAKTNVRRADGSRVVVRMHRLILGLTDPRVKVDHRDGNGLNNQRANMRACTDAQNGKNRQKNANNTSGYKGVTLRKRDGKWHTSIMANGKRKHLGYFSTPEAAYAAYCAAAKDLHGEYANLGVTPAKKWSEPAFSYITKA